MNLIAECIGRHMTGTDQSKPSRIGDGGGKLGSANPCHTTLEDWILDAKHPTNRIVFKH
jgi:hypothetical protein